MMVAPTRVPATVPRPPKRLPPPMMTAAITSSSRPTATVGSPTDSFENCRTPPAPANAAHGAQRDDEGHDAQARDEQPVREPADRARGDAAERRRPWPAVALQQQRDDDGAERDHRAHGQIDAPRDDHHRHPERRHAD